MIESNDMSVLEFLNKIPSDYNLIIEFYTFDDLDMTKKPELLEKYSYKGKCKDYVAKMEKLSFFQNLSLNEFSNIILNVKTKCCYMRIEQAKYI